MNTRVKYHRLRDVHGHMWAMMKSERPFPHPLAIYEEITETEFEAMRPFATYERDMCDGGIWVSFDEHKT